MITNDSSSLIIVPSPLSLFMALIQEIGFTGYLRKCFLGELLELIFEIGSAFLVVRVQHVICAVGTRICGWRSFFWEEIGIEQ